MLLKQKSPHLLDIDGDSCHHIHNVAKALCTPFNNYLERLFTDLYLDFRYCTQYKALISEICRLGNVIFTAPQRFIPHRWLNAYDRALETTRLLEIYIIFYSAFLPMHIRGQYRIMVDKLINKFETNGARQRVHTIISILRGKTMTADGRKRKERITSRLFQQQEKTLLLLNFYQSVLHSLKVFVLRYQKKEPLIHSLHVDQVNLTRRFLCNFIPAVHIKGVTADQLKQLDLTVDHLCHKDSDIFVGKAVEEVLGTVTADCVKKEFFRDVRSSYLEAGRKLLDKLPLDSRTLKALSALNPEKRHESGFKANMKELLPILGHLLTDSQKEQAADEIPEFISNDSLPKLNDGRVDVWWGTLSVCPTLKVIAKAALSIFHGPQVESSFSLMKDIMNKKAGSMAVGTFSSIQTVKYFLKSRNQSSIGYFRRPQVNHTPVPKALVKNMRSAYLGYNSQLKAKNAIIEDEISALTLTKRRLQSAAAARKIKQKAIVTSLKKHERKSLKRKAPTPSFSCLLQAEKRAK